jgi:hypothetical protein
MIARRPAEGKHMGDLQGGWVRWLRNGLAAVTLVLAVIIFYEGVQARGLQDRVNAGHASLVKAQTFANLDNGVIQLIAKTAAEKNDADLRGLLASNGVTFHVQPPGPGPAPTSSGAGQ